MLENLEGKNSVQNIYIQTVVDRPLMVFRDLPGTACQK